MTAPAADDGPCYYNDNDPEISSWLANLVAAGMLPEGRVDGRDIAEVRPADIEGARQVHLFAGIGGWALALRLAGAEHLAGVWTASCPCQPFSVAGAKQGTDDERHLWPDARTLIEACRPRWVFGEQTPGPLGMEWLDGVIDDCEAMGYTVSAAVLPASAVGAPHMRHRIYFAATMGAEVPAPHANLLGEPFHAGRAHPAWVTRHRRMLRQRLPVDRRRTESDGGISARLARGGHPCGQGDPEATLRATTAPAGRRPGDRGVGHSEGVGAGRLQRTGAVGDDRDGRHGGPPPGPDGAGAAGDGPAGAGCGLADPDRLDGRTGARRGHGSQAGDGGAEDGQPDPGHGVPSGRLAGRPGGGTGGLGNPDGERPQGRDAAGCPSPEPTEIPGAWDFHEFVWSPGFRERGIGARRIEPGTEPLVERVAEGLVHVCAVCGLATVEPADGGGPRLMLGRTAPPQRADALNAGIAAAGPEDGTGFLWCPRCARRCEHSTGSRAAPSRAVLVRGYGNAIVPQLAAVFVRAALDARGA